MRWVLRVASSLAVATGALMAAAAGAYATTNATVVRTTIASGTQSAFAICPAGEDATGGGVALSGGSRDGNDEFVSDSAPVNSSRTFSGTTTGTVPVGWYGTSFINTSGSTPYVWAVCSSTPTSVVRTELSAGAREGFHSGYARCRAGQQATGGGLGILGGSDGSHNESISDDGPVNSSGNFAGTTTGTVPVEWYGTALIETPSTSTYVWAVCSHLATSVVRTQISAGAQSGFHSGYARCPAGERATGGGAGMSGGSSASDSQTINDTGPVGPRGSFDGTVTGSIPTAWYATGFVDTTGTVDYAWAVCG